MKRYILIVAAVALATVSCSRHYDLNTSDPQVIGFGTWADQLTKARDITEGAFGIGDSFNVFGSKVLSDGTSVVFNGDPVNCAAGESGLVWNYTPPRFWDPAATSYTFYAISPAGLVTGLTDANKVTAAKTGAFTTDEITFTGGVVNDIMIAKKNTVTPSGTPAAYSNPVTLDFQHVATLIDVKVKKSYALKDATVEVTGISLENVINKGTYKVESYGADNKPVVAIANWDAGETPSTTTFYNGTNTTFDLASAVPLNQYGYESVTDEALSGTENYFWQNFVVMPQTLSTQQIKISYKITQTATNEVTTFENKTVAFAAFDGLDNKTEESGVPGWNPGIHYVYTLTLDANKIEFAATITPWPTATNAYYNLVQ